MYYIMTYLTLSDLTRQYKFENTAPGYLEEQVTDPAVNMSDDAHRPPKFEWDYDVPRDAFWSNLNYSVGRNFLQRYTSSEISEMTFDENLSVDEKLDYLLRTPDNTLAKKEMKSAPVPLKDADHATLRNILPGLSTIEHFAGNPVVEEELIRERYENGPDAKISVHCRIERDNGGDW
jgi:hypothetical protein